MTKTYRRRAGLLFGLVLILAAPAPASAATATATGDDGQPMPLSGNPTMRNMKPEVAFGFAADERRYTSQVLGPDGAQTAPAIECTGTSFTGPQRVRYRGNGVYTVVVRVSKNADDAACAEATEQRFTFTINAFTGITPPSSTTLLMRRPEEFSSIAYEVPVNLNPGADSHELRYAAGATLGADGGISGASETAFVDSGTGKATVRFTRPGRYTFVARAKSFAGGDWFTPWSSRVDVNVVAPFDLSSTSFPDSRGPSYKLAAQVRETSVTGRVKVAAARGKRGKRFKRLGTPKIRSGGKFSLRFRLRRKGYYVMRYSFPGSATVAPGTVRQVVRIRRTFGFSSSLSAR